jgi:hypothetical protein
LQGTPLMPRKTRKLASLCSLHFRFCLMGCGRILFDARAE